MRLSELNNHSSVVIQCHDNPDADALASGWGVYTYCQKNNIPARFIYGGKFPLQKSNLVLMKETFEIPIEYVSEMEEEIPFLVTVDCQYGEGNVAKFPAKEVAVIDHHRVFGERPKMSEIRSNLGSCATVVWDMLAKEGIDVNEIPNLSTALYYGLMTDTNGFAELNHPLDRDLRDKLDYKKSDITLFRNSNLSLDELKIAGEALKNSEYNAQYCYGLVESQPCDPNILGVIGDMFLEVQGVNACLVYTILKFGVKLSLRSCFREVQANELAAYLAEEIGSGGGSTEKAGGFLDKKLIEDAGYEYTSEGIRALLGKRMETYFTQTEVIYVKDFKGDLTGYPLYTKKELVFGYVDPADMGLVGTEASIRTLEGDIDIILDDDMYIMIGVAGEIYPQKKTAFLKNYKYSDEKYVFSGEYEPSVKNTKTGDSISIIPYAKACLTTAKGKIHAMTLDHRVKLFTSWDEEKYYLGKVGDHLVARYDNPGDVYIVAKHIFDITYEEADQ